MKKDKIKDQVLEGAKRAFRKLLSEKKKENGFIIISQKGRIVNKRARTFNLPQDPQDFADAHNSKP